MTRTIVPCPCEGGRGTGRDDENRVCSSCFGRGYRWSDGEPPTVCPAIEKDRAPLACRREGDLCPSCLRLTALIPSIDDVIGERRRAGLKR